MPHPSPPHADREKNTAEQAMKLLRLLRLSAAETLTQKQYQVFTLHFLEGMKQKEIAAEFGLSASAVCRTYAAALKSMREFWNT